MFNDYNVFIKKLKNSITVWKRGDDKLYLINQKKGIDFIYSMMMDDDDTDFYSSSTESEDEGNN